MSRSRHGDEAPRPWRYRTTRLPGGPWDLTLVSQERRPGGMSGSEPHNLPTEQQKGEGGRWTDGVTAQPVLSLVSDGHVARHRGQPGFCHPSGPQPQRAPDVAVTAPG